MLIALCLLDGLQWASASFTRRRRNESLANHASAAKATRQAERRRLRNRSIRSTVRSQLRGVATLVASGTVENADATIKQAFSAIDKALKKGVVHPNNAARHKSRLAKKLHAAAVQTAAAAAKPEPVVEEAKPKRAPRRTTRKAVPAK